MAMPLTAAWDRANELLDYVVAEYASGGIDLPDRQYAHVGAVALDCPDQLTVTVVGIGLGISGGETPFPSPPRCAVPTNIQLQVLLTRCVPTTDDGNPPTPPSVADLEAASATIATDATLLSSSIARGIINGDLFGDCKPATLDLSTPYGPEGTSGGWLVQVTVSLT